MQIPESSGGPNRTTRSEPTLLAITNTASLEEVSHEQLVVGMGSPSDEPHDGRTLELFESSRFWL